MYIYIHVHVHAIILLLQGNLTDIEYIFPVPVVRKRLAFTISVSFAWSFCREPGCVCLDGQRLCNLA